MRRLSSSPITVDGPDTNATAKIDAAISHAASLNSEPPPSRFIRAYALNAPIASVAPNNGQNTCADTARTAESIAAELSE